MKSKLIWYTYYIYFLQSPNQHLSIFFLFAPLLTAPNWYCPSNLLPTQWFHLSFLFLTIKWIITLTYDYWNQVVISNSFWKRYSNLRISSGRKSDIWIGWLYNMYFPFNIIWNIHTSNNKKSHLMYRSLLF